MSTCTSASASLAEPVAATAATARTWLLIEQPGPWGAKALGASRLDPATGRELERLADGTGTRVALIRRPGRHADLHLPRRRRVYLAHTAPGASWVRTAEVADPAELTALDFTALGAGAHNGFGDAYDGAPLALVCTNGKRDRCCAVRGRPLAAELTASGGSEVWEVTHLGGHRFAPTMLVLPYGYTYGRVDAHHAKDVLEAARSGRMVLDGCRGRSAWDRPGQAADLAVRELTGEDRTAAVVVEAVERTAPAPSGDGDGAWAVRVAHVDGRVWEVTVTQVASLPPRPESCGAALGTPARMEVTGIERVAGGRAS
ncbi:sucrase ferredoxin [Streptomyces sp. NPDC003300]|uniref:sucrase ferredoxin n=1 Tax=unclassified Streptomyces TaxID=2593676 RepID=UPI0033A92DB1